MADITAAMVKELRTRTEAGMSDCKNALVQAEGDMAKAVEVLQKMGKAKEAVDEYKIIYMADSGYSDVAKKINDFYESQKGPSA